MTALGFEFEKQSDFELAEKWYLKSIKLKEDFETAYRKLFALYAENSDEEALLNVYRLFLRHFNDDEIRSEYIFMLYKNSEYEKVIQELNSIKSPDGKSIRLLKVLAHSYRKTRRYQEAKTIYHSLLKKYPYNKELLVSYVLCLEKTGKRKAALELLEGAFAVLKPDAELLLIAGVMNHKLGDTEKALAAFRLAGEANPEDWRVWRNISIVYRQQGVDAFADKYKKKSELLKKSSK
jgi:tetratricopeptide (TPR) repeat protein